MLVLRFEKTFKLKLPSKWLDQAQAISPLKNEDTSIEWLDQAQPINPFKNKDTNN
jgi:hypothetical protein